MRITSGKYRGRTVEVAKGGLDIRPAMDRMRESVFAVLGDLAGLSFLDLFSGSGIIALEALSRGAFPVACVEKDPLKFKGLLRNVSLAEERIECHCLPVERFILRCRIPYSVIFCDPPFPYKYRTELLRSLADAPCAALGGLVLLHYPREEEPPGQIQSLSAVDERVYGRSRVRFYRKALESRP